MGCHPLRKVPSPRRRGSIVSPLGWPLSLAGAVGAWTLIATTTGACVPDHHHMLSRSRCRHTCERAELPRTLIVRVRALMS